MTLLATISVSAAATVASFLLVSASGCGTDAVGVDDCRRIEIERCRAGVECGVVKDLAACERYYRDQCLHGLPLKRPPSSRLLKGCVETIRLAGECAKLGAETELAACVAPPTEATTLRTACDIVASPEATLECAFLTPDDPEPAKDAGSDAAKSDAAPADAGAE